MSTSRLDDASREEDLIDRWLDEGDRLSESARTSAGLPGQKQRRVAEALADLRAMAERRRFAFVTGAVVVSAVAIVGMRAASHAVLKTGRAVASDPPGPAPQTPNPVSPAAVAATARSPDPPPITAAVAAAPTPDTAPGTPPVAAAVPSPDTAPGTPPVAAAVPPPDPALATPPPEVPALADWGSPKAPKKPDAAISADSLEACQAALRRERAKAALIACERVASDHPASADALVLLAHANLVAGSGTETLRLARRASFLDPRCADAYLMIGTVLQAEGRMPDARSAYQSYLHNAPQGSHAAEVRAILKTL